jgi:very-short-patch-repair endonuclease
MKNKPLPYNPQLKILARKLRKQGILSEVLLWKQIKNKSLGIEFHRQVPIDNYIVDFFCHELMLAIEVDGSSHFSDEVEVNDKERQEKIEKLGINFIRVGDIDVKQRINIVIWTLENKIQELQTANIPLNPPSKGE